MVKVCPATLSVPVRCGPALTATANATLPLPFPEPPPVMLSQSVLFENAVQPQPVAVVTTAVPEPPPAAKVCGESAIENVHGAACCVTVSV